MNNDAGMRQRILEFSRTRFLKFGFSNVTTDEMPAPKDIINSQKIG